jgi:hypothetical protein
MTTTTTTTTSPPRTPPRGIVPYSGNVKAQHRENAMRGPPGARLAFQLATNTPLLGLDEQ